MKKSIKDPYESLIIYSPGILSKLLIYFSHFAIASALSVANSSTRLILSASSGVKRVPLNNCEKKMKYEQNGNMFLILVEVSFIDIIILLLFLSQIIVSHDQFLISSTGAIMLQKSNFLII